MTDTALSNLAKVVIVILLGVFIFLNSKDTVTFKVITNNIVLIFAVLIIILLWINNKSSKEG